MARVDGLRSVRRVHPEERERERPVALLNSPVPRLRRLFEERKLVEMTLMELDAAEPWVIVDHAQEVWRTEVAQPRLLLYLPKQPVLGSLACQKSPTRQLGT